MTEFHGTVRELAEMRNRTERQTFRDFKIEGSELLMYQNLFLGRLKKFNEKNNIT